jgi:hypothetical protein
MEEREGEEGRHMVSNTVAATITSRPSMSVNLSTTRCNVERETNPILLVVLIDMRNPEESGDDARVEQLLLPHHCTHRFIASSHASRACLTRVKGEHDSSLV